MSKEASTAPLNLSEMDLAITTLGFRDENIMLYQFVTAYLNSENHRFLADILDYKQIFEVLIPKRLFEDIPAFLIAFSESHSRNLLPDLPVFKKLKMTNITNKKPREMEILPNLNEKYMAYIEHKDKFRFPKSTFTRLLAVILNPIQQTSNLKQYTQTLEKLFIPLPIASYHLTFNYNGENGELVREKQLFIEKANSQESKLREDRREFDVQPKLQVWLKTVDSDELSIFVNDLRKIMSVTFGYEVPEKDCESNSLEGEDVDNDEEDENNHSVMDNMKRLGTKVINAYTEFAKLQTGEESEESEEDDEYNLMLAETEENDEFSTGSEESAEEDTP